MLHINYIEYIPINITRYIRIKKKYITKVVYNMLNLLHNMLYDILFS